jgi:VWFA-related protein
MKKIAVIILVLLVSASAQSQKPKPSPAATPLPANDDDVVKIDLSLVQVDAVVTDKNGRQVTNLSAENFSIIEKGKSHPVDYCVYIPLAGSETNGIRTQTTRPPSTTELGRTFVFLVDNPRIDLAFSNANANGISSGSFTLLRRAIRGAREAERLLTSFVENEVGPRDLVAIGDTEVDLGVLSSFTNDRATLRQAIRQIRSNPTSGRAPTIRITSINGDYSLKDLVDQNLRVIETISSVIKQLETLPGRKVITLLSRGMLFEPQLHGADIVIERMHKLIDQANRARVSINALTPAGVGNFGGETFQNFDSLIYLANETGGRAIYNTNDTRVGFAEIVERSRGYYLLAYKSEPDTHARPHSLKVQLNRDDLRVEARTTAYARTASPDLSPQETLSAAINSPLRETAIPLDVTPSFVASTGSKGDIKLIIKVGVSEAELVNIDEMIKAEFDLAVRITGPDGKLSRPSIHQLKLEATAEARNQALQEGITTLLRIPVDTSGFYRVSVAVQSKQTKQLGSTTNLIEALNKQ